MMTFSSDLKERSARSQATGRLWAGLGWACVAALASSCNADLDGDPALAPVQTSCSGQALAEILVQDGYLESLCGCAENQGSPVIYSQPSPLTCTVPTGTTVFFIYEGSVQAHQIFSTGSPSFPTSPLWDPPSGNSSTPHYAYTFSVAGTYTFMDAIDQAMNGSLVVQTPLQ